MTEQFTDLVERRAGRYCVGSESVAQLVRMDTTGQSSALRQVSEQFVECGRPHRRAQRFAKKVDQQEITPSRLWAGVPLQHVLIEGLHDHPVHRDYPGSARLRGRAVDVGAAADVHMLTAHTAPKPSGIRYEMDVFHPHPGQFATPMTNAPQCQDNEAVPGVPALSEQRQNLFTGGRVDNAFRFGQTMPGFGSHTELWAAADVTGQIEVLHHVEQHVQNGVVDFAYSGGMAEELTYGRQDHVDPTRPAHNARYRSRRAIRVEVLQPEDKAPELARRRAPVALDRRTPLEEQRQRPGVGLRGRLGTVTAKAHMQKPVISCPDGAIADIDHGPVALARGQFDPKRSERSHRVRRYGLQPAAAVNDTPSDCVVHQGQRRYLRPSPTRIAPVQKDLFHSGVSDFFVAKVWAVMALNPHHIFLVLTKRHGRMRSLLKSDRFPGLVYMAINDLLAQGNPWGIADSVVSAALDGFARGSFAVLPNVHLIVSAEDQENALLRIPALLDTPAAIRGVSLEPLLSSIDLTDMDATGRVSGMYRINALTGRNTDGGRPCPDVPSLDWVIVGGESGHRARPMHPDWARSLRDQCQNAGVPLMFKQWGSWRSYLDGADHREPQAYVNLLTGEVGDEQRALDAGGDWSGVWRLGKHAAGRELDGEIWDQYPPARPVVPA